MVGWHTLKRNKTSIEGKVKGKDSETNEATKELVNGGADEGSRASIKMSGGRNVQTLLAKALYDNVAEAPDELTFRKGDIVTVLEQDVDGLTGWWLCLLHGDQGIAPGNRLKVIPPDDLAALEKDTSKRGSGVEYGDDPSTMYDFLPTPVKADPSRPPPLTIKEMFDIPYKKTPPAGQEIYDVPKGERPAVDELYDTPKSDKSRVVAEEVYDTPRSNVLAQQEVYDVPKTQEINNNTIANTEQEFDITKLEGLEIYDTPTKRPTQDKKQELYDVPTNRPADLRTNYFEYDSPRNTVISKDEVDSVVPKTQSNLDIDKLMGEIYDSPFSEEPAISTIKRSPTNSKNSTPRHSMNVLNKTSVQPGHEIYDVPTQQQLAKGLSEEIYDVPTKKLNKTNSTGTSNIPSYASPASGQVQDTYDLPKSEQQRRIVYEETYDIPTSKFSRNFAALDPSNNATEVAPASNSTPSSNRSSQDVFYTPPLARKNMNQVTKEDVYDTPPSRQDIYDTPPTRQEIYDTPPTRPARQEIYDTPPIKQVPVRPNRQQDIYDTPPTKQDIYDTPPSRQEIYDTPPQRPELLKAAGLPISTAVLADREELYDVPNRTLLQKGKIKDLRGFIDVGGTVKEDIYDSPTNHSMLQVMGQSNNSSPGDDYVDYHDVWKDDALQDRAVTALSPDDVGQKRSILDQINFDLVKELEISSTEALEQLRKLHLAVDTCVQTLLSFWSESWLETKILKQTIRSIREFSGKLKTALRLLTEFGLSTLINCTKVPRGESLMDKLIIEVEPLLESYYKIKICLLHLDSNDWQVPDVRNTHNEKFFATLNAIMILSERLPELCKAFNLGVQNKVHELFRSDPNDSKHITPLLSFQPTSVPGSGAPRNISEPTKPVEPEVNSGTLKREMADRRQQARDSTIARGVPHVPPKPSLPNPDERKSLSATMEIPESPRVEMQSRGGGFQYPTERLVTEYEPQDNRSRKYASDPTTPSCTDNKQKTNIWGGSCPTLMDRHSSALSTPHGAESLSSASSVSASIPEETIVVKQTAAGVSKDYNSDSNINDQLPLSPLTENSRSASLPWDDRLKNNMSNEDRGPNTASLSPLDHRDIESLEFFCRQVESQVVLLRESMKNLTEAVENQEEPVVFVQYAKFISLTGHRVFHCGQDISERLINNDIKSKLKDDTAHLTLCIRGVVAATKTAAVEYPNAASMMEMISSVLALGDAVRIIYSVCRKALDS